MGFSWRARSAVGARRRVVSLAATAALTVALPTLVVPATGARAAEATGAGQVTPEARADAEKAAETGEQVEVVGERTPYTTTFADPDGVTFTLKDSAVPVRVRKDDGSWMQPDATLEARS